MPVLLYRTHRELQSELQRLEKATSTLKKALAVPQQVISNMQQRGLAPGPIFDELEQYHLDAPAALLEQIQTVLSSIEPIHFTVELSARVYDPIWQVKGFSLDVDYAASGRSRITIVSDATLTAPMGPFQHIEAGDVIELVGAEDSGNNGKYTVYAKDASSPALYITLAKSGDPGASFKLALEANNSEDSSVRILLRRRTVA